MPNWFSCCFTPLVPKDHTELSRNELKSLYKRSVALNNGRLIVHGIFARADTRNNNKRVYPKHILKREVLKFEKEHVLNGTALGELDHPNYASRYFKFLNLPNISHQNLPASSVPQPHAPPSAAVTIGEAYHGGSGGARRRRRPPAPGGLPCVAEWAQGLDRLLLYSHYLVHPEAPYLHKEQSARDYRAHLAMFATRAHLSDQPALLNNKGQLNTLVSEQIARGDGAKSGGRPPRPPPVPAVSLAGVLPRTGTGAPSGAPSAGGSSGSSSSSVTAAAAPRQGAGPAPAPDPTAGSWTRHPHAALAPPHTPTHTPRTHACLHQQQQQCPQPQAQSPPQSQQHQQQHQQQQQQQQQQPVQQQQQAQQLGVKQSLPDRNTLRPDPAEQFGSGLRQPPPATHSRNLYEGAMREPSPSAQSSPTPSASTVAGTFQDVHGFMPGEIEEMCNDYSSSFECGGAALIPGVTMVSGNARPRSTSSAGPTPRHVQTGDGTTGMVVMWAGGGPRRLSSSSTSTRIGQQQPSQQQPSQQQPSQQQQQQHQQQQQPSQQQPQTGPPSQSCEQPAASVKGFERQRDDGDDDGAMGPGDRNSPSTHSLRPRPRETGMADSTSTHSLRPRETGMAGSSAGVLFVRRTPLPSHHHHPSAPAPAMPEATACTPAPTPGRSKRSHAPPSDGDTTSQGLTCGKALATGLPHAARDRHGDSSSSHGTSPTASHAMPVDCSAPAGGAGGCAPGLRTPGVHTHLQDLQDPGFLGAQALSGGAVAREVVRIRNTLAGYADRLQRMHREAERAILGSTTPLTSPVVPAVPAAAAPVRSAVRTHAGARDAQACQAAVRTTERRPAPVSSGLLMLPLTLVAV
ncbi:MAG: hypothetical protein WDW38_000686 [Sanguina aurantia]